MKLDLIKSVTQPTEWAKELNLGRKPPSSPKGNNSTAQGIALGPRGERLVEPCQGSTNSSTSFSHPGCLPWAIELFPFGELKLTPIRLGRRLFSSAASGLLFLSALLVFFVTLAVAAENSAPPVMREIGIDQRLGERVPLDLEFRDEAGRIVQLREYFGSRPVVLSLVYYECPMLCSMVLNGLVASLRVLNFDVGDQFDVVTVSFDPRENFKLAGEKKANYLRRYARPGAERGWHFLTGDLENITELTRAAGFRYRFDPETKQFAHASAIMVLTPTGQLSHYFYGIEYPARDLRLALVEASRNKVGSLVDQVLLYCYQYDPKLGKYSLVIMRALRLAGTVTVLCLAGFVCLMLRRERKNDGHRSSVIGHRTWFKGYR